MAEPIDKELVRRAVAVDLDHQTLGTRTFVADGAEFIVDPGFPSIYDANHAQRVTVATEAELDRMFARLEREFAFCRHRMLIVDPDTPPRVEARLALEGFVDSASLVMVLAGALVGRTRAADLRVVSSSAGWDAYLALKRFDWREKMARHGVTEAAIGDQLAAIGQRKSPWLRYWLVYQDGEPRGFCSAWQGREGVGQVEDLFVHPAHRHRGLATALVHRCVADCRDHGAGPVALVADAADTPKQMYARMGFRPVALVRKYLRELRA